MSLTFEVKSAIREPWLPTKRLSLGQRRQGVGTPASYVCVSDADRPFLVIELSFKQDESYCFSETLEWAGHIAIGWGHCVYIIDPYSAKECASISLDGYFGSFHATTDRLLVASASRVLCILTNLSIAWKSPEVGIDGVVISGIEGSLIAGKGEWDPPGGWKDFKLDIRTGAQL